MKSAKSPTTHLGNNQLHKQHSVMIEGGAVPRARVMDQTMIDLYLMRGLINLTQHRAGEFLLRQASIAGIYPKTINWTGAGGTPPCSHVPVGAFAYGSTLSMVEDQCGKEHARIVRHVVCDNLDVAADKLRMKALKRSLDCIADRKMGGRLNPLRFIQKSA